jgi:hypothetical protein
LYDNKINVEIEGNTKVVRDKVFGSFEDELDEIEHSGFITV